MKTQLSNQPLVFLQEELLHFSRRQEQLLQPSSFTVWNLQPALDLLQEVEQRAAPPAVPRAPDSYKGWLPRMTPATTSENILFALVKVQDLLRTSVDVDATAVI